MVGMKINRFWPIVNLVLVAVFGCFIALPKKTHYGWQPTLAHKVAFTGLMVILVAVAWAICFRRQIEGRQVKIFSVLVLVAMEAVLFSGIHYFRPF